MVNLQNIGTNVEKGRNLTDDLTLQLVKNVVILEYENCNFYSKNLILKKIQKN